jgi:opacity protein-like surface antigen
MKWMTCWAGLVLCLCNAGPLGAETYVAGELGLTVPLPGTVVGDENIDYPNAPAPGHLFVGSETQIGFKDSVAYGVKLGHYLTTLPWLGFETEALTATPHVQAGTIAIDTGSSAIGTFREAQTGLHLRMTTWAFTLLARYPGVKFQPYAGIGPAIFFAHVRGTGLSCNNTCAGPNVDSSSISPGFNAQLGLRYLITSHVALFGEWKFTRTSAHFDHVRSLSNIDLDYQAHFVMFGVGYHF